MFCVVRLYVLGLFVCVLLLTSVYANQQKQGNVGVTSGWLSHIDVSLYLPVNVDVNSDCAEAINQMYTSTKTNQTWSIQMVDSWGKINDGVLFGYDEYIGMYDECVQVRNPNYTIAGKYCRISIQYSDERETPDEEYDELSMNEITNEGIGLNMKPVINIGGGVVDILAMNRNNKEERSPTWTTNANEQVTYGTCMPNVCTTKQLKKSLDETLKEHNLTSFIWHCHVEDPQKDFNAGDISFICVVSLLMLLVLMGTILDIFIVKTNNQNLTKGGLRYLMPFSAYTNVAKMFHLNTKSSINNIACLHGMRVLSMTWVIYAHQLSITAFGGGYNWEVINEKMSGLPFQALLNGYPSVDTFFFLSGFLVTLSFLRQLKAGKFNIFIFYIHRIIRLVPPLAITTGMVATIMRFFLNGPISSLYKYTLYVQCTQNWWIDILFINNIHDMNIKGDCLGQTWYLAVDMQLYIISPLIIIPLYKTKALGRLWLYIISIASIIIPTAIIYAKDLPPTSLLVARNTEDYFYLVYNTPWCRAGPWVAGIWLGYIIHNLGNRKIKINPIIVMVGWSIATITGLLVVFGMWSYNIFIPQIEYDIMTSITYGGLHRPAWGACLAWIVFACYNGYGGMVNDFLGHPVWQPLSRLTYTTYLLAIPIQSVIFMSTRTPYYFSHINKVMETVGGITATIPVAVLLSLLTEGPVLGLEKLILNRDGGRSNKQTETGKQEQQTDNQNPTEMLLTDHHSSSQHDNTIQSFHNSGFIHDNGQQHYQKNVTKF